MAGNNTELENSYQVAESAWKTGPKEFIFKYLKYVPWVLLSLGLFLVLAYIKIRYATNIYRVTSSILIKNDQNANRGGDARFQDLFMPGTVTNLSNEMEILKSPPVLQRVARDLNLETMYYFKGKVKTSLNYPNPPFFLSVDSIEDINRGFGCTITLLGGHQFLLDDSKKPLTYGQPFKIGNNLCRIIPNGDDAGYLNGKFEVGWHPVRDAANYIAGSLGIGQLNQQATILTLSFEGENAALGNDVLNTLMAVYDSIIVEDKSRINANTLGFINGQLRLLNDTLKGAQGGLRDFMIANQVFDLQGQSKDYMDNLKEVSKGRDEQAVKLKIIDWLLDYINDKKNANEIVPTVMGIQEPTLLPLIQEYNTLQLQRTANLKTTPATNPLITSLETSIERVRKNIYQALLNVRQSYMIADANLEQHEKTLRGGIRELPGKSMQLVNKERQQRILEDLYSLLLQKKLETQIASAATVSNTSVVQPAVGEGAQISPDVKKIFTLYFFFGLLIPVGIITVIEVMRDKVTGRADVEKHTTTPILGEVGHSDEKQTLVLTKNSRRFISEQFRIIRTNLRYIIAKKEKPVIMITSSFGGEGKSFISTNIGAAMALAENQTVIMEFDIRKPKIVSGLELKRKMGITNYLIGSAKFEDLLVKVEGVENLYVIPCGPIPPNPSELLLDPRLDNLMEEVKKRFDVVIMDTAPVGLVSDAMNLSRFADCTLYIIRQAYTFRKQLPLIEELYVQNKLPKVSVLINDVKAEGGYYGGPYRTGYGYYGGYGYAGESGYFEEDRVNGRSPVKRFRRWWKKWFA
jgi:tyrosine-protein kinase Etk/Wzc